MIHNISIQGFKSIANVQNLELGRINVFVGANGCGKSNLLEAIGVLGAAASGHVDSESLSRRGVRLSPAELYKTLLRHRDETDNSISFRVSGEWGQHPLEYTVSLKVPTANSDSWKYIIDKLSSQGDLVFNQDSIGDPITQWSNEPPRTHSLGGKVAYLSRIVEHKRVGTSPKNMMTYIQEYAIFSPTTPVLRGLQSDAVKLSPLGLTGGGLAEAIDELLNPDKHTIGELDIEEVLDLLDWVDEFSIGRPSRELLSADVPSLRSIVEFKDRWMGEKRNRLSGYDASEGSLYVLFMLVLALHPKSPKFFAVDNFDQALNPRLARALTRLFSRIIIDSARQALLTTHNPLVLDGLNLRDDRIRLFAVERNQQTNGATKISRVKLSEKILEQAENGTPLSQMWVMGLLGGVPDIF